MKELNKKILDLENEKIRKRRETKTSSEEVVKLETQLSSLQKKDVSSNLDDKEVINLEEELDIKQRRLKRLHEMINQQKAKNKTHKKQKSMSQAKKMVNQIGEAIDNIQIPQQQLGVKSNFKKDLYNDTILEEEVKFPLDSKLEEILDFASHEYEKVAKEREKARLEHRLISGLKNNLFKENYNLSSNLSMYNSRRGLLEIHSHLQDSTFALESERKTLEKRIEKCKVKEKELRKISSKKDVIKTTGSMKLRTNVTQEIYEGYEDYMRTYVYKGKV